MDLAKQVYEATKSFPKEERHDLVSQMRRAAVSIPSNIVEGSQRSTKKDFAHFLLNAKGSLAELQTQMLLAQELGYLSRIAVDVFIEQMQEIDKMIYAFHGKILS